MAIDVAKTSGMDEARLVAVDGSPSLERPLRDRNSRELIDPNRLLLLLLAILPGSRPTVVVVIVKAWAPCCHIMVVEVGTTTAVKASAATQTLGKGRFRRRLQHVLLLLDGFCGSERHSQLACSLWLLFVVNCIPLD